MIMTKNERINKINNVLEFYFNTNPNIKIIKAKDLMPLFIKNGIFEKDHRDGLPIRKLLRELNNNNELRLIPYAHPERKKKYINWFFISK